MMLLRKFGINISQEKKDSSWSSGLMANFQISTSVK